MAEHLPRRLCLAVVAVCGLLFAVSAAPAQACDSVHQHVFGLSPGCFDVRIDAAPTATDLAPSLFQAGGHPYAVTTAMRINAPEENDPVHSEYWPPEPLRDVKLGLPAGLVADPSAVPACTLEDLNGIFGGHPSCSPDSQVGVVKTFSHGIFTGGLSVSELPLFRVSAPADVPARFGFNPGGGTSTLDATALASGALSIDLNQISGLLSSAGIDVELWGVPAAPAHTPKRACSGQAPPTSTPLEPPGPSCASGAPERAFLRLPTSCTGPAEATAAVDSWMHPGEFQSVSVVTHRSPGLIGDPTAGAGYPAVFPGLDTTQWGAPQGFEGCAQLPFDPAVAVQPSSHAAGSPTGLDVALSLPQQGLVDPTALAESDLRAAVTKLPVGLTLNPAVANGLLACAAAQFESEPPSCPAAAKLGTVTMISPLQESPLKGSIYIAERRAGEAGTALPAYIVAGSGSLVLRLRATLDVAADTGQVSTTLSDSPQVPISSLRMHFFDGDRAPFVTPPTCGTFTAHGRFMPWSGAAPVEAADSFAITSGPGGSPCPAGAGGRPFGPGFRAGVTDATAGAPSALTVKVTREDGEQEPSALRISLPPGLSASLAGVPSCADTAIEAAKDRTGAAELSAPSCPAGARLGGASLLVGAGSEPFRIDSGQIYLAGPYQGSAFSFAVIVPAVAGPIDLGTLVMRLPLKVDPVDGHLTLGSAIPTAPKGVPLNLRQIVLNVDRPGFIANPTSCDPATVSAGFEGDAGATATGSSPFQISGCERLGFGPRLRTDVLGKKAAVAHTAHPAMRFTLSARQGDAGISGATIAVAGSEQLDPSHIRGICSRDDYAADACPADSTYGYAEVVSPMLAQPLRGPVYMRSSSGKLPDLVAALHGELDLDLAAKIGFAKGRLRIAMPSLPDVPISKLTLTTWGGRRGLFVNNRDLCTAPAFSTADLVGHNDKRLHQRSKLRVACGH